jgi:hypothetical protein
MSMSLTIGKNPNQDRWRTSASKLDGWRTRCYNTRAQYQRLVIDAATSLAKGGYLLTEDIDRVVEQALSNWDDITRGTTLAGK